MDGEKAAGGLLPLPPRPRRRPTKKTRSRSVGPVATLPPPHLSDWMTLLPAEVRDRPLTLLAIPGSHDSFASRRALSLRLPVANDESDVLRRIGSLPGIRRIIRRWAVTQDLDVSVQLRSGIRYFDLRVSLPPFAHLLQRKNSCSTGPHLPGFRLVHALYGPLLLDFLRSIADFLRVHPGELVIIDINHTYGCQRPEDFAFIQDTVLTVFSARQLVPTTAASSMGGLSLRQTQRAGWNVLVLTAWPSPDPLFWPAHSIYSPWPNSDKSDVVLSCLESSCADRRAQGIFPAPSRIFVGQGIVTAQKADVIVHPFSSLKKRLALPMTRCLLTWLREKRAVRDGVNIVIADFIDTSFSEIVISSNFSSLVRDPITD